MGAAVHDGGGPLSGHYFFYGMRKVGDGRFFIEKYDCLSKRGTEPEIVSQEFNDPYGYEWVLDKEEQTFTNSNGYLFLYGQDPQGCFLSDAKLKTMVQ